MTQLITKNTAGVSKNQVGGKGYNLIEMQQIGIRVPNFCILHQAVLKDLLPEEGSKNLAEEQIFALIDNYKFDSAFWDELKGLLNHQTDKKYSVRSSAIQEDGQDFSFAGQFESFLYVEFEDITKFIKKVWKSNFNKRVIEYHKLNNIQHLGGIAVVIQEMIDPDVSGVAFGRNPNTGIPDSKVICSVYGVGEGIVSGALNADTFNVQGTEISREIVTKEQKAQRKTSGTIELIEVAKEYQEVSSLDETGIKEIIQVLNKLEEHFKAPQDIEFAIKDNVLYLLQSRPITTIPVQKSKHNRIIWDNSNIIESYPGVTTPLTFSYIIDAYKNVYVQLALIMGASKKTIRENEAVFANMLGLINGRVYYNLFSWYQVLALFPGYKLNARFMENMMGVKERFDLPKQPKGNILSAFYRSCLMVLKIVWNLMTIKKTSRKFLFNLNQAIERVGNTKIDTLSAFELKELWINLDREVTPKWKAPVINDSFAMIYFGRLQKTIEKYKISDNPNIQNDLLCGSSDIISVEPIHESFKLSTMIVEDSELSELFGNNNPKEIWAQLEGHRFKKEVENYIEKFGDRCVGELKLETVSFKQEPTLFIQTLKSFSAQKVTSKSAQSNLDKELREAAEKEIDSALKYRIFRKRKLKKLIKKTRYFVSNRENLRYERTRIFGVTRTLFLEIGKRFKSAKKIDNERDIFFLTKDEIFQFIDGISVSQDLKSIISVRKKEYQKFEEMDEPAERFTTYDSVHIGNDFYDTSNEAILDGELKGLGCCPGVVKAKVRKLKHPNEVESLNGDILITSSTDPGWVTLFPTASAIIVERGSLLSHSAIVSREMGIPCIVGVTGLLKSLNTGDTIEMDGSTGVIKIIEHEGATE